MQSETKKENMKMSLTPHLLVNFVEHCRIVVFFGVVVETDHAILLVNASVDLTILNLEGKIQHKIFKRV